MGSKIFIALLLAIVCFGMIVYAESGTSNNYNLDYGRSSNGADVTTSSSYGLIGGLSDESVNGDSASFSLNNVYADIEMISPICGNGILEIGEQCEGVNFGGLTCTNYSFNQGDLQCMGCQIVTNGCFNQNNADNQNNGGGWGGQNVPLLCGNGQIDNQEQCDDGNKQNGDGCNFFCGLEVEINNENKPLENIQIPKDENGADTIAEKDMFLTFDPQYDPNLEYPWLKNESSETHPEKTNLDGLQNAETDSGSEGRNTVLDSNLGGIDQEPIEKVLKPVIILDETPLITAKVDPNSIYELVIDDGEKEWIRQGVESDSNGLLVTESIIRLDYGDYEIRLLNEMHEIVYKQWIKIEDYDYRVQEDIMINAQLNKESIALGTFDSLEFLTLVGKSNSNYHAYLQDSNGNIDYLEATANEKGEVALQFPKDLKSGTYILNTIQVFVDGKVGKNLRYVFVVKDEASNLLYLLIVMGILLGIALFISIRGKTSIQLFGKVNLFLALLIATSPLTYAIDFTPHLFVYEGKLLDANNNPVVTAQSFRFSMWNSDDLIAGDILGDGSINAAAANYGGWQEVHTVTPNANGTFFVDLGKNTPIDQMLITDRLYLQVEIKNAVDPDINYEVMDPTGDNGVDADDRQTIGSSSYANNADYLDNAEIGTTNGNIATLGVGDMWDINYIPGATNVDSFTIDKDNSVGPGGTIDLIFGQALAESLSFDIDNDWFDFSNDVNFNQNQIKNVAIDNLAGAPGGPVAGQIYHNTTDGNTYIWNGLAWEDITAGGGLATMAYNAEYKDSTVEPDGINNRGILSTHFVDEGGADKFNYYQWDTTEVSLQDMNIYISFKLPENFQSFTASPLSIFYQTNDGVVGNNRVDVNLYDSTGTAVALVGGSGLANNNWSTANITFGGVPTFIAGDNITLVLQLSALDPNFARVADVVFSYNTN